MASVEHRSAREDRASCVTRALAPTLTPLDERVVALLPSRDDPGVRARAIRQQIRRRIGGQMVTDAEVRAILRGLEHLGRATGRGGWWRAL